MSTLSQGNTMACDLDDLHRLLYEVLYPFKILSKHMLESCPENVSIASRPLLKSDTLFYQKFHSQVYILRDALRLRKDLSHWGEKRNISEDDIRYHLMSALDELESRFLSKKRLVLSRSLAKFPGISSESYPKLRVLQKSLHISTSTANSLTKQVALDKITSIVRIASKDPDKRLKTLHGLTEAAGFFSDPDFISPYDHEDFPFRFEDYPYRHVRGVANSTYDLLVQNWSCQTRLGCTIQSHTVPSVQLSLTTYRGFGLAPLTDEWKAAVPETSFRLLFPTGKKAPFAWQSSKITIQNSRRRDSSLQEVLPDLCDKITTVPGGRQLNMLVYDKALWLLRPCYDMEFRRYTVFKDLNQLLRTHEVTTISEIDAVDSKDRLILSFVLAKSVLHLHHSPWLKSSLSSSSICFLPRKDTKFDITEPFLTTYCSTPNGGGSDTSQNPHCHPDILSLGVLLLEIASGAPLVVEDGVDQGVLALELFDTLEAGWWKNRQKPLPAGLPKAIKA